MDNSTKILVAVDASNFSYACAHAATKRWEKNYSDEAITVLQSPHTTDQSNLPDLLNFNTYRSVLNKVVQEKLEMVNTIVKSNHPEEVHAATGIDVFFAMDDKISNNFRRTLYPEYKLQRKSQKLRYNTSTILNYILNVIFKELNVEGALGYKLVKVDGCECDDIIATLMTHYTDYMCRIIISSDRDFLQLTNVYQYNVWGERVARIIANASDDELTPGDFILWKIIRGDISDNIKSVFPKYGDKKSLNLVNNRDELKRMLNESNDATERFKLNMSLIDFRRIPEDITNKTLSVINEKFKEKVEVIDFNLDNCLIF
jgi:5'-3' exonuclease